MTEMKYYRPETLEQALAFLDAHGSQTEILAGGTDVMVDIRSGVLNKKTLLDVNQLAILKKIEITDEGLCIGSGVTLSEINTSHLVKMYAPALGKCTDTFASRQIRNIATIGGNVAHASPCGDTIPPLVIHEARAVVANQNGVKEISMDAIAAGAYQSTLASGDIIVKFILKPRKAGFADFQKIARRRALAISRMTMAVMADKNEAGNISFVRFSLGACTPTPHRMDAVESFLMGHKPTHELLREAGTLLAGKMVEITGRRSSIIYKEPAVQGLFMRMMYPMVGWCEK
ncbi:MAG: FAD binding domain-containing protein [Desulfobacterium sp.]